MDDEADIVSTLADYFLYNDYNVMTATNGMEAIEKAGKQPDFLTARVEDSDKIKGFGMGGDDYIVKPFSLDELGARVPHT